MKAGVLDLSAMEKLTETEWERQRHEAECAYWLDAGYVTRRQVDQLIERIAQKRGRAAAERLRDGMRAEWKRRQEAERG